MMQNQYLGLFPEKCVFMTFRAVRRSRRAGSPADLVIMETERSSGAVETSRAEAASIGPVEEVKSCPVAEAILERGSVVVPGRRQNDLASSIRWRHAIASRRRIDEAPDSDVSHDRQDDRKVRDRSIRSTILRFFFESSESRRRIALRSRIASTIRRA